MFYAAVNVIAGTAAATVYTLWGWKWITRRCWVLGVLNLTVAAIAAGIAVVYALLVVSGEVDGLGATLRPVVSAALVIPAVARMMELRRDVQREAVARSLKSSLKQATGETHGER